MLTKLQEFIFTKAYAQTDPGLDFFDIFTFQSTDEDASTIFGGIVGQVLAWVIAIIALIAFIYLILNGVKYITAGGDAAKATEARTGIINAIIGIVVVLLAYVILRFAAGLGEDVGSNI